MKCIAIGLLLLPFSLAAVAQPPKKASESDTQRLLRTYQARVKHIDGLLVEGESRKALRRSDGLLDDMAGAFMGGEGISQYLGLAMVLRSLAAFQEDRLDDALWHWQTAVQLLPRVENLAMTAYAEAGEFLRSHPPRERGDVAQCPGQPCASEDDVVPPRKKKRTPIQFPPGRLGQRQSVTVRVETIIGTDGTVREPVILESKGELTMVLAVLRGMREWEYHPATLNGEAVPVTFTLTANFATR